MSEASLLTAVLDELIARFGGDEHAREIALARAEYDPKSKTGVAAS